MVVDHGADAALDLAGDPLFTSGQPGAGAGCASGSRATAGAVDAEPLAPIGRRRRRRLADDQGRLDHLDPRLAARAAVSGGVDRQLDPRPDDLRGSASGASSAAGSCGSRAGCRRSPRPTGRAGRTGPGRVRRVEHADGEGVGRGHDRRRRLVAARAARGGPPRRRPACSAPPGRTSAGHAAEPLAHRRLNAASRSRMSPSGRPLTNAIRRWPSPIRWSRPARIAGRVVDVDGRDLQRARALPERDDRDDGVRRSASSRGWSCMSPRRTIASQWRVSRTAVSA